MGFDVIIAGGGLNGCAMALALGQVGLRVALVDPLAVPDRANPGFDGRSYALAAASKRMLDALGLWQAIAEDAQPILEVVVSDGRPGQGPAPFVLEFDHAEIEEGPTGFMVEDRHLRAAMLSALNAAEVTHLAGQMITDHSTGPFGVTATLDSGEALKAPLLIAADGARSEIAARAGVQKTTWGYDQSSLVAAVTHEKPHNGIAHQMFMPAGPLAILPLKGNRSSIVWTETTEDAARIQALDDAGYLAHLRPIFGDFLGEIGLEGARFTYPLGLSLAHRFVTDRTAVIGDAAHKVHPLAGQGLNAGLKDVAALAEVLAEALRRGEDIGRADVLERYQAWRRFDVATLAAATDGFNRLFSNDNGLLRTARDLGMATINAWPEARRGLIREAAGLTGDLPKLLQGKAI